jgi:hypothetical protein
VTVFGAVSHAMWALNSSELIEIKAFYNKQVFDGINENEKENIREFNDLISRIDSWIKDAVNKENFTVKFDLGKSEVDTLKKQFTESLEVGLRSLYPDICDYDRYREIVFITFESALSELPDYFESNHFFRQLLKIPTRIILNGLLNDSISSIIEESNELFFYSDMPLDNNSRKGTNNKVN